MAQVGICHVFCHSHYVFLLAQDVRTRHTEKANFGFPMSEGIGRLQVIGFSIFYIKDVFYVLNSTVILTFFFCLKVIKNSDLEELRELGSGTFGTVYHGKWRGSDVAIKRINDRCFAGKASEQDRMVVFLR